jgi:hypothetical protein
MYYLSQLAHHRCSNLAQAIAQYLKILIFHMLWSDVLLMWETLLFKNNIILVLQLRIYKCFLSVVHVYSAYTWRIFPSCFSARLQSSFRIMVTWALSAKTQRWNCSKSRLMRTFRLVRRVLQFWNISNHMLWYGDGRSTGGSNQESPKCIGFPMAIGKSHIKSTL